MREVLSYYGDVGVITDWMGIGFRGRNSLVWIIVILKRRGSVQQL